MFLYMVMISSDSKSSLTLSAELLNPSLFVVGPLERFLISTWIPFIIFSIPNIQRMFSRWRRRANLQMLTLFLLQYLLLLVVRMLHVVSGFKVILNRHCLTLIDGVVVLVGDQSVYTWQTSPIHPHGLPQSV